MTRSIVAFIVMLTLFAVGLADLVALSPNDITVAVFNGNGARGMAGRTQVYLQERGFAVSGIHNAETFEYETTYLVMLTESVKAELLADYLPVSVEIVTPEDFRVHYEAISAWIPLEVDAALVLGAEWPL